MAIPYIDTPRTEIDGNATYLTNGFRSAARHNLSALDSVENSFISPSKDGDILKGLGGTARSRRHGDLNLKTPRAGGGAGTRAGRNTLFDRRNLPNKPPAKGEFTPLLNSVAKNNFLRNRNGGQGHTGMQAPGLPTIDVTESYEDESTSLDHDATPVPQIVSSSVHSTPLPGLSGQGGNAGVVGDGNNMMTLREQEQAINKLDKENFGLKLKIHFLDDMLRKAGPEMNKTALKENAELKVAKITLQKDLARCKKSLRQAEYDVEAFQQQLQELRDKGRLTAADKGLQTELEALREELEDRELKLRELQQRVDSFKEKESDEIQQLRDDINDLQYDLRQKELLLDEKDEELERLKEKAGDESSSVEELQTQLEDAQRKMEDLQESLDRVKTEAQEAKSAEEDAVAEKEQAVEDLQELQDEMADKSFHTKGLSRQLEERAEKVEEEYNALRKEHATLREHFADKSHENQRLQAQLQELKGDLSSKEARLHEDLESTRHEQRIAIRQRDEALAQLRDAEDEFQANEDQKDILQNRHDALTNESASLSRDLEKAKALITQLEDQAEDERNHSLSTIHSLQARHKDEIDRLTDEIESLRHEIEDKDGHYATDQDKWESMRRSLELQREKAEQEAAGYKRTIDKHRDSEQSLSSRESRLRDANESERQRHLQEEQLLNRQIQELNDDIATRRQGTEAQRQELLSLKEELRVSKREENSLKEKIQLLEDEVVVLQAGLEDEQQYAKDQRKIGSSDLDKQLQTVIRERQAARDQLADANTELHNLRTLSAEIEAERDELHSQLNRIQNQVDDTHRLDQDKVDLRKAKLRLEGAVTRLKEEKKALLESRDALQTDLDNEVQRSAQEESHLSAEISQLQDKLYMLSEKRDRELVSAKNKAERLHLRAQELEALMENRTSMDPEASPSQPEISILRRNLDDAREKQKTALQREAKLKTSVRELKAQIIDLERENFELKTKELTTEIPDTSPPSSSRFQEEIRSLRALLLDANRIMKELKAQIADMKRAGVREEERRDLHELLKSSTLEAEALAVKLSERDTRMNELRNHLRRIRGERASSTKKVDSLSRELDSVQQRYEALANERSSSTDKEAALSQELESLQERYEAVVSERSSSAKKTESLRRELESLQQQYEAVINRPAPQQSETKDKYAKELNGLGKEITWLKARLVREEQFRDDLVRIKKLLELGEQIRVAHNQKNLEMLADMGFAAPPRDDRINPRRKLKAAVYMCIFISRAQRVSAEWRESKRLGEKLLAAKLDLINKRKEKKERSGGRRRA
ncbi:hypothetical protein AJ80_04415 [Polytolypa hystricis UAMH7299]|uniref:Uncharacterized protein n=1 Tax=Polytolypa hystricis (strain UAMH7299) TaxID=1447883 RepID=A0A2B7YDI6_POLH7|nr:hypothetical protein AJ80_04415 [Polytolypa hystricis UAMH7299]